MAEVKASSGLSYKPYVPAETDMKELTFRAIFLGIILAVVLGAANAYLGLKAGMTVAATFPAAVISMAVLRIFKGTILEENMARTTGAVGEALAAGAIFTIPAFIIAGVWDKFYYIQSTLLMLVGGVLGVLFVIILRRALIEDVTLPYPESKACAEIVKVGQSGSTGAAYVFGSMILAGIIEFFKNANGLTIIKDHIKGIFSFGISKISLLDSDSNVIPGSETTHEGRMFLQSPSASPAFLGVGYIIGFRLAAITFSGGVFGWLFLMPIALFLMSSHLESLALSVADSSWIDLAKAAYNSTIKPIAVGGMLVGAFYTLFKMRSSLISGVSKGITDIRAARAGEANKVSRIDKDAPFGMVFIAIIVLVVCMVILYKYFAGSYGSALVAAIIMAIAGFMFAAVAGYLVGIIGSSSNPISGLTLTTLLVAALLMLAVGLGKTNQGIAATLAVASVVCCVAGVAGDMIQDWKVGHILGATPYRMQIGGSIGVVAAALILVLPIMWLHQANGIGSDALPAPQAGLMAMMSKGIISGEMAWPLVIAGMFFSIALILINSPSPMLIAVGMYLPFTTTFAIFIGGIIKYITDKLGQKDIEKITDAEEKESKKSLLESVGLLVASGMVAGEALIGIILAILVVSEIKLNELLGNVDAAGNVKEGFAILGFLIFIILAFVMIYYPLKAIKKAKQ
jgi:putative OPT family oligopeptide transporter